MIYLNEVNLEEECREFAYILQLEDELRKRKIEFKSRLKEKAKVYYGNESGSEFQYMKSTPAKFVTDDRYEVELRDYEIIITVQIDGSVFEGRGTRYDKDYSDLTFSLLIWNGVRRNGNAKKYEEIRNRMKEIQSEYCIENPFRDFESTLGSFLY